MTEMDLPRRANGAEGVEENAVPSAIRLRIVLAPGDDFEAQRQAVRAAGADYDSSSQSWLLWLVTGSLTPDAHRLERLFAAADRYHTSVGIDAVRHRAAPNPLRTASG